VRVHAGRETNGRPSIAQAARATSFCLLTGGENAQRGRDPRVGRACNRLVEIRLERLVRQMAVGVDHLEPGASPRGPSTRPLAGTASLESAGSPAPRLASSASLALRSSLCSSRVSAPVSWLAHYARSHHRMRDPGGTSLSKLTSVGFPPSGLAARIIPFDSIPINFAGFRLNTIPIVRPTSCSGS
jgi:hypothetical protein